MYSKCQEIMDIKSSLYNCLTFSDPKTGFTKSLTRNRSIFVHVLSIV